MKQKIPVMIVGPHGRVSVRQAKGSHAGSICVRIRPTTVLGWRVVHGFYGATDGRVSFHTRDVAKALRCATIFVNEGGEAFELAWSGSTFAQKMEAYRAAHA